MQLQNEHIYATAMYYYDCTNISTCRLSFRQQSDIEDAMNVDHPSNQHNWLEQVFGCEHEESAVQETDGIDIKEGRLVTWPNILQYQAQPMRLADPSNSGHCKTLVLYLVDPNICIISTANVPCQRGDW
jgi:hypothetical protein